MIEVIKDLSSEDYHNRKEVGKSDLDLISKSMDHYLAPRKGPTPQMELGTAFHTMILEPDKFEKLYVKGPEVDRRHKNEWKKAEEDKLDFKRKQFEVFTDQRDKWTGIKYAKKKSREN